MGADIGPVDLRAAQRRDPVVGPLLPFISNKQKPYQLPAGQYGSSIFVSLKIGR